MLKFSNREVSVPEHIADYGSALLSMDRLSHHDNTNVSIADSYYLEPSEITNILHINSLGINMNDAYESVIKYLKACKDLGLKTELSDTNDAVNFKRNLDLLIEISHNLNHDSKIDIDRLEQVTNYKRKPLVERLGWLLSHRLLQINVDGGISFSLSRQAQKIIEKLKE